jgi:hypothetical protein
LFSNEKAAQYNVLVHVDSVVLIIE